MVYRLCQPGIGLASRASGQSAAYRVGQRGIEQVSRIPAFVNRCLADSTHGVSQRIGLVTKVPRKLTSSESPGRFRFRFPIQWHVHQLGFGHGSLVVVSISGRCLSSDDCCCRRVFAQTPTLSVPVSSAVSSHNRNRKSKREDSHPSETDGVEDFGNQPAAQTWRDSEANERTPLPVICFFSAFARCSAVRCARMDAEGTLATSIRGGRRRVSLCTSTR